MQSTLDLFLRTFRGGAMLTDLNKSEVAFSLWHLCIGLAAQPIDYAAFLMPPVEAQAASERPKGSRKDKRSEPMAYPPPVVFARSPALLFLLSCAPKLSSPAQIQLLPLFCCPGAESLLSFLPNSEIDGHYRFERHQNF